MTFTDTHTHIYLPEMTDNEAAMMQRAFDQGVKRFFLPNIDSHSIADVWRLAQSYPDHCFPMMGLHPCSVKGNIEEELAHIEKEIDKKIYAIGEIGIDLYWEKGFLKEQQYAFKTQIQWAKKRQLPIVIHCRDAFDEVLAILQEEADSLLRGIFHCFTGNLEQAQAVIQLGFYLGIGGVVTYKNSGLDKVVEQLDLKHIVLETDSPYLTPVPFRGKPNESAYLKYVAQKVADLHQRGIEEIATITTHNASAIFGI